MKTLNCMLQTGPSSLHYYCAVVLHSCIVLPPVGNSSNHQLLLSSYKTIQLCFEFLSQFEDFYLPLPCVMTFQLDVR